MPGFRASHGGGRHLAEVGSVEGAIGSSSHGWLMKVIQMGFEPWTYGLVNYNNSLNWIVRPFWGDSSYKPWFQGSGKQWGRFSFTHIYGDITEYNKV